MLELDYWHDVPAKALGRRLARVAGHRHLGDTGPRFAIIPRDRKPAPRIRSLTPGSFTLGLGSLTAALVGLGVVVAALLANPITD